MRSHPVRRRRHLSPTHPAFLWLLLAPVIFIARGETVPGGPWSHSLFEGAGDISDLGPTRPTRSPEVTGFTPGNAPLVFEPVAEAGSSGTRFVSRALGPGVQFDARGVVIQVASGNRGASQPAQGRLVRVGFEGGNPDALLEGSEEAPARVNYLLGKDSSRWRTNVKTFVKVRRSAVYPGIDLVYYGNQRRLEYDFHVAAGADPEVIAFRFEGVDSVAVDDAGDLVLKVGAEEIRQHKPVAYQMVNGRRREVEAGYELCENFAGPLWNGMPTVGFKLGHYDNSAPLVIDPILTSAGTLGGAGLDRGSAIAVDAAGNSYITGATDSADFPTPSAFDAVLGSGAGSATDAFVAKFDPTGALIYSTYLGGSSTDSGVGIAVDATGGIYVSGFSFSTADFPVTGDALKAEAGAFQFGFVAKLNPSGSALVYCATLGGAGQNDCAGIAVDSQGNAWVTGSSNAADFPTASPLQGTKATFYDAFVAKLNPAGSELLFSTFLGGSGFDFGRGIALDGAGNAYVVGEAGDADFPTTDGAAQKTFGGGFNDAFIAACKADGSALIYSTLLGGGANDTGRAIAVDAPGNAVVTGSTGSSNFPTKNPLQPNRLGFSSAYVTKLDPTGKNLVYSTFLGGGGVDDGYGIALDADGNAYVTGSADSPNFPTVEPLQSGGGGGFVRSANGGGTWQRANTGMTGATVKGIAFHPQNSATLYVASYGGVMKSTDNGATWTALNNGLPNPYALAIAIHPTTPATLFASVQGGLFKSVNDGAAWTPLGGGLPGADVNALVITPSAPATVYAATAGAGVFKSVNEGATWASASSGLGDANVLALVADPRAPGTLYAGIASTSGSLFKSTDGGASWLPATNGLPMRDINAIAIHPSDSSVLFAATHSARFGGAGGIYVSRDGGTTWAASLLTDFPVLSLAIDPTTPTTIYAGQDTFTGRGLLKSVDGGSTWTSGGLENDRVTALAISPTNSQTVFAGLDGGTDVFLSVLKPDGSALAFSTLWGGTGTDYGQAVAVDATGQAHLAGYSHPGDFPKSPGRAPIVLNLSSAGQSHHIVRAGEGSPQTIRGEDKPDVVLLIFGFGIFKPCLPAAWSATKTTFVSGETFVFTIKCPDFEINVPMPYGGYGEGVSDFETSAPPGFNPGQAEDVLDTIVFTGVVSLPPGTYSFKLLAVEAIDPNNCESSQVFTFTVLPKPGPALKPDLSSDGTRLVLEWTATAFQVFQLQSQANLTGNAWAKVTEPATVTGDLHRVEIAIQDAAQRFFRLVESE